MIFGKGFSNTVRSLSICMNKLLFYISYQECHQGSICESRPREVRNKPSKNG